MCRERLPSSRGYGPQAPARSIEELEGVKMPSVAQDPDKIGARRRLRAKALTALDARELLPGFQVDGEEGAGRLAIKNNLALRDGERADGSPLARSIPSLIARHNIVSDDSAIFRRDEKEVARKLDVGDALGLRIARDHAPVGRVESIKPSVKARYPQLVAYDDGCRIDIREGWPLAAIVFYVCGRIVFPDRASVPSIDGDDGAIIKTGDEIILIEEDSRAPLDREVFGRRSPIAEEGFARCL